MRAFENKTSKTKWRCMMSRVPLKTALMTSCLATVLGLWGAISAAQAKTVKVDLTAKEVMVPIDNKGNKVLAWTYDGQIPGPVVRATEGDTIEFTLTNDAGNKKSHSIDFHAARADVLTTFASVKPGETKKFTFTADNPGAFFYHCGSDPMIQHIARGMIGAIIIDPKDPNAMPKADREYILVEHQTFDNPEDVKGMMANDWQHDAFNGVPFQYDPVHDENATQTLEAKPGERVRIYLINAGPNEFSGFHPIAGIWDKVYPSGNPKNVLTAMQNYTVAPGDGATFDLISPVEGANALVNHSMRAALSGAIAVVMFSNKADPSMGHGDKILPR
jgi:nitrite reductase (NO-forming)